MEAASLPAQIEHAMLGTLAVPPVCGRASRNACHRTPAESGLTSYQAAAWNGYVAPAGVDAKTLDFLNAAFNKALSSPAVKQQLNAQAYEVHVGPRQALFDLAKRHTRSGPMCSGALARNWIAAPAGNHGRCALSPHPGIGQSRGCSLHVSCGSIEVDL